MTQPKQYVVRGEYFYCVPVHAYIEASSPEEAKEKALSLELLDWYWGQEKRDEVNISTILTKEEDEKDSD